jgi:beta-N-acetylhexosaminidase
VPAAIRRRRLAALGAVGILAAALGALAGAGGDSGGPTPASVRLPQACRGASPAVMRRLAGMKLMVRWDGVRDRGLEQRVRDGLVGGVILFPAADPVTGEVNVDSLRASVRRLQAVAERAGEPPLLVATDQEGGTVKRFPAGPPSRPPADLDTPTLARREGTATGRYLRGVGVNVDLAPVLDLAHPGSAIAARSFGSDPAEVSRLGSAFAAGLQGQGVAATAKHFPGLGRSAISTDESSSAIDASRADLRSDLEPFAAAAGAGIDLVMVGLASYPAYGAQQPAAFSRRVVHGLLRGRLGYAGIVITDDLSAGAVAESAPRAAVEATTAGADVLLFALERNPRVVDALTGAVRRGQIPAADLRRSCARLTALRASLAGS